MKLSSTAFASNEALPARYTCEANNVSPPLRWSGAPPGTRSFALLVHDPDAPDPKAPKRDWVHWLVYDIPPDREGLSEGGTDLGPGAQQGKNDWGERTYGGPCPPIGRHRYFFELYALDTLLGPGAASSRAELEHVMTGHVLASARLIGTYQMNHH